MEVIKGRYGESRVFARTLEDNARAQIKEFCDQGYTEGEKIKDSARRARRCGVYDRHDDDNH